MDKRHHRRRSRGLRSQSRSSGGTPRNHQNRGNTSNESRTSLTVSLPILSNFQNQFLRSLHEEDRNGENERFSPIRAVRPSPHKTSLKQRLTAQAPARTSPEDPASLNTATQTESLVEDKQTQVCGEDPQTMGTCRSLGIYRCSDQNNNESIPFLCASIMYYDEAFEKIEFTPKCHERPPVSIDSTQTDKKETKNQTFNESVNQDSQTTKETEDQFCQATQEMISEQVQTTEVKLNDTATETNEAFITLEYLHKTFCRYMESITEQCQKTRCICDLRIDTGRLGEVADLASSFSGMNKTLIEIAKTTSKNNTQTDKNDIEELKELLDWIDKAPKSRIVLEEETQKFCGAIFRELRTIISNNSGGEISDIRTALNIDVVRPKSAILSQSESPAPPELLIVPVSEPRVDLGQIPTSNTVNAVTPVRRLPLNEISKLATAAEPIPYTKITTTAAIPLSLPISSLSMAPLPLLLHPVPDPRPAPVPVPVSIPVSDSSRSAEALSVPCTQPVTERHSAPPPPPIPSPRHSARTCTPSASTLSNVRHETSPSCASEVNLTKRAYSVATQDLRQIKKSKQNYGLMADGTETQVTTFRPNNICMNLDFNDHATPTTPPSLPPPPPPPATASQFQARIRQCNAVSHRPHPYHLDSTHYNNQLRRDYLRHAGLPTPLGLRPPPPAMPERTMTPLPSPRGIQRQRQRQWPDPEIAATSAFGQQSVSNNHPGSKQMPSYPSSYPNTQWGVNYPP